MTEPSILLAALPDPVAELELRRQLAREAYERGRGDGWREGYERSEADAAERWNRIAGPVARGVTRRREIEGCRWHVCCRPCRRDGHREGCPDCSDRTRESFGEPLNGDYAGGPGERAAVAA